MKIDIILAGVGGQGILSIATVIGYAAVESGLYLKQAEVHGMSQRGGDVQSHLRLSDKEIASDLIPYGKADLIISVEPMEGLRYLPYLKPNGWLITNTSPFVNIPNYPKEELLMAEIQAIPNHIALDAAEIAGNLGSKKAANMVILGAASPFINIRYEMFEDAIRFIFAKKDEETVKLNLNAINEGRNYSMAKVKK